MPWPRCSVTQAQDDLKITVVLWVDGIATQGEAENAEAQLKLKFHRLILAWQFLYGQTLRHRRRITIRPNILGSSGLAVLSDTGYVRDWCVSDIVPGVAPADMPQVPEAAEPWIATWAEATSFGKFVEEHLRRHYLIIEELWPEFKGKFQSIYHEQQEEIKLIRDFVSHAKCTNSKVVDLVRSGLPDALDAGSASVSFRRIVEHRNFVAMYEVNSRYIAKSLVHLKIGQLQDLASKKP